MSRSLVALLMLTLTPALTAGTLEVVIERGRLVLKLPQDILFGSGSAELGDEGVDAITEVGGVLGPLGMGLLYDLTAGFSAGLYFLVAVSAAMLLATARLSGRVDKRLSGS